MNFICSYLVIAEIYAIATMSTTLLVGISGIFSISQGAIFGVGAYVVGILLASDYTPFLPALVVALLLCAAFSVVAVLPALRILGDYFVVASFGIQMVASTLFINLSDVTGGASGLTGIPQPVVWGLDLREPRAFAILSTMLLTLAVLLFWQVMRSPFGRMISAMREDETAIAAAGKNIIAAKIGVAAFSGLLIGCAGGLYAVFLGFIDPSSFDIDASILFLTMMVVGGARTLIGSLIGPALLTALPQLLSMLPISNSEAGPLRQIIFGAILIYCMLLRPQGLAGRRL